MKKAATDISWSQQIDKGTWLELTTLSETIIDTVGLITPLLELADQPGQAEKERHIKAAKSLALRGHLALKKFAHRWAEVYESVRNDRRPPGESDDLTEAAADFPPADAGTKALHSKRDKNAA